MGEIERHADAGLRIEDPDGSVVQIFEILGYSP